MHPSSKYMILIPDDSSITAYNLKYSLGESPREKGRERPRMGVILSELYRNGHDVSPFDVHNDYDHKAPCRDERVQYDKVSVLFLNPMCIFDHSVGHENYGLSFKLPSDFYTQTSTLTVTTAVPKTTVAPVPTATSTLPCVSKRDGEDIELLEKRGAAIPSLKMSSKMGVAILGALAAACLM
ncbi:hypothetical protein CPB86DRAFT_798020 [Serendipita vermifera]|nr:hypothetical protein CPB86DRAFT_798020 [Serendipita vermifera]